MQLSHHSPKMLFAVMALAAGPLLADVNVVQTVAPNVYFHEGELTGKGHCNNGWIVLEDYVLVIDGNFPSGAEVVIPKIKASSQKPIRFTFDTHHHGDHAYGNQVWNQLGAVLVAHEGVISEMRKYEGKFYNTAPSGRWEEAAKARKDVAGSRLSPPTLLFKQDLAFDDGKMRVELKHFGTAHTHGDGFAWLPKEGILFTGDACVNGAFNYMGDGNLGEWIKTLQAVQKLNPKTICPGHGPMGGPEVLEDQIQFFVTLRQEAGRLLSAGKTPAQAKDSIEEVLGRTKQQERIKRFVGKSFASQLEKVWMEMGGSPFPESGN